MSYLLYFPGATAAGIGLLDPVGLSGLADSSRDFCMSSPVSGPDGGKGIIAAPCGIMQIPGLEYLPSRQVWRPARPDASQELQAGRYWIGRFNGFPITPDSLARSVLRPGGYVRLADGHDWLIPIARQLPHVWGLLEDGEFGLRPADPFVDFCKRSEEVYVQLTNGEAKMTLSSGWKYACDALALNYRVTPDAVDFLSLIDTHCGPQLIGETIELQAILTTEAQKKTESAEVLVT